MEENKEEQQVTEPAGETTSPEKPVVRRFPWVWIGVLVLAVAFSVMLTYTLTASKTRTREIQSLQTVTVVEQPDDETARNIRNMEQLVGILREKSYYADSMGELDGEALLKAVVSAYIAESGDIYAAYYTEEEYEALAMDVAGNHVGIGVTVTRKELNLGTGEDDEIIDAYQIEEVYPESGAEAAGLAVGEWICAVKKDGAYLTIAQLNQQDSNAAVNEIRGEAGTQVELMILRWDGSAYESRFVTVTRSGVTTRSVRLSLAQSDPTVAVIKITGFDYTTPSQFVEAVEKAKAEGALHYVFDVRGNPGGELWSIYAVLSNFLRQGDLVLAKIDAAGNRTEYRMYPIEYTGSAAGCSVKQEQIGQYHDLDFVVLCDGNTASAAEVFTATLRDFELAKEIFGQKTYGKGIVQNYGRVELDGVVGYLKVTVGGYVTECGVSYHGIGIEPTISVVLPESVRGKSTTFLPWEDDTQLKTAVAYFSANNIIQ